MVPSVECVSIRVLNVETISLVTSAVALDTSVDIVSVISLFVLTVDSVSETTGVSVVLTGRIVYRLGGFTVAVTKLVVGTAVSIFNVCVVLESTVVSVTTFLWEDFFVFGGVDDVGRIADAVVFILL